MILIPEAKIINVSESRFGDITLRIHIKKEDITAESIMYYRARWNDGEPIVVKTFDSPKINTPVADTLKGRGSIYQRFKFLCEELGVDYNREKAQLGVKHLSDLEKNMDLKEIEQMLEDRISELKQDYGFYNQ